ncbi:MAG: hypothetical protein KGM16_09770 [Bacteroidota bacterium]|nr:hypothetical protein [Bacteroidota bacterium]
MSTLLKKLQKQLDENSSAREMLQTVQILQAELIKKIEKKQDAINEKISILMPVSFNVVELEHTGTSEEEEKVVQVLQVDEKDIEEELAQIKKNAEAVNAHVSHSRPGFLFDPLEEVPTLAHQDQVDKKASTELNFEYPESLNDRLKESKIELSQSLTSVPIKDLRKAIGVNDRFLFINELFRGDEAMYERSIKTIQNFTIYAEAEFWIKRELKVKIGWLDSHPVVKQFDQLIKRRFA